MDGYQFFDRQYRISFGKAGETGVEIGETTEAKQFAPHIEFDFQKSDLKTQNTGKLSIWNLNDQHLSVLNQSDCAVIFRAGYGDHMPLIFSGIVSNIVTKADGADKKTEIEVIDNLVQIRDTFISVSYGGKVSWKTIFDDVAAKMGVAIQYSYNATFANVLDGYSYVGLAKNIFDKGCSCCGLTWSLQNGIIHIKQPDDAMTTNIYLLNSSSGLIGIPERVVISDDTTKGKKALGWDVEYFLNGAINIDDLVKVESKTVTGYFRVQTIEMKGDNVSGDWLCKARLLEVKEK